MGGAFRSEDAEQSQGAWPQVPSHGCHCSLSTDLYIFCGEPRGATTTPFHPSAPPPQSIRKLSLPFPQGALKPGSRIGRTWWGEGEGAC